MSNDIAKTKYYRYAKDVTNGDIVAGELMKLACQRFLDDVERDDLEFHPEIIERFNKFASLFKHFKGNAGVSSLFWNLGRSFSLPTFSAFTGKIAGRDVTHQRCCAYLASRAKH